MKGKKLMGLIVAAAVMVGLAVISSKKNDAEVPVQTGQLVLPDLKINTITKITITTANATTTIGRSGDIWVSLDTYSYPADFGRIRNALIALSELKIGQALLVTDEQKQALDIVDPTEDRASGGIRVDLYDASEKKLASLILGKEHMSKADTPTPYGSYPDGRYVSADGGQTVFLVANALTDLRSKALEWLNMEIANVTARDIEKITIENPGTAALTLSRDGDKMVVEGLNDLEEMDATKPPTVTSSLSYLRFSDIADPTLSDEETGMTTPATFRVTTTKGEIYTAALGGKADNTEDRYFRISVTLDELPPVETNGVERADVDKLNTERAELASKVDELQKRVSSWTYVISSQKAQSMLTKREDVVKAREPEQKEEAASGAPSENTPTEDTPEDIDPGNK